MKKVVNRQNIFIVGCSRAGTTLLQSILSNSDEYATFPETNILYHVLDDLYLRQFPSVLGRMGQLKFKSFAVYNRLGYTKKFNNNYFINFLKNIDKLHLAKSIPHNSSSIKEIFYAFHDILTKAACGKPWIEKTPQNIFCVELMQKHFGNDIFIHIIRNNKDNISSLIDAARKYDDFANRFGGKTGLYKAIDYWNMSVTQSIKMKGQKNHFFIRFEDLVSSPLHTLEEIADAIDLEILPDMIKYDTQKIILNNEQWKKKNSTEVIKPENKFERIFSSAEKKIIQELSFSIDETFPRKHRIAN